MADYSLTTPSLWIEAQVTEYCYKDDSMHDFVLHRKILEEHIRANFVSLQIGQTIRQAQIDTEVITMVVDVFLVLGYSGTPSPNGTYHLSETAIQIHQWHPEHCQSGRQDSSDRSVQKYSIPSIDLAHTWKPLIFEDGMHFRLLRYMIRMTQIMRGVLLDDSSLHNWNRLCLLHGPPGGGKTTLCRALAQQLGVFFGGRTLLQIDCNDLLSKYFGESAKHVTSVFDQVKVQATQDHRLLVILLDEVESIAASRTRSNQGQENLDGLRATNALLKMLDDLKGYNNVIVLCTTNMVEALDSAFLDRVDIKQHVPLPSSRVIYDFFRSSLNDMASRRLFNHGRIPDENDNPATLSSTHYDWQTPIPSWEEMNLLRALQPEANASKVWDLSKLCSGMSGRTLRRLPIVCLGMYTFSMDVSIEQAIAALGLAAQEENKTRATTGQQ